MTQNTAQRWRRRKDARPAELLDAALEGTALVESRRLLSVVVFDSGCPPRRYHVVNDAVLAKSALARIATIRVEVEGKHAESLMKLMEALEEHDDVSKVASNVDVDLEALAGV